MNEKGGTSVLKGIEKAIVHNQSLVIIYQANDGSISKRRIKPYRICDNRVRAYCYLRTSNRTFKIDNILALVPVTKKESMVV